MPHPLPNRRTLLAAGLSSLLLVCAVDLARPPEAQWSAAAAIAAIHVYQHTAAPLLGRAGARCRFTPSCSRYAEAVVRRHGLLGGSWRAAWRVARCGPWTRMGTVDPPD